MSPANWFGRILKPCSGRRTPTGRLTGMSNGKPDTATVTGIVLAAGAGSRFGMPKVLAGGGVWLKRAVAALGDGGCDDVIVVLGAAVVGVPEPARAVIAEQWNEGMSASVREGVAAAGAAEWVVLHTVDTPDIGADVVARVLSAARAGGSGLARASYGGRPGHPVVVARRHLAALTATLHGDQGARVFLRGRDDVAVIECGDLATGLDIDER